MSKLKDPDFLNIFQNYDILFFQETKTDNLDHLSLPDGFTYVAKHRKKCLRKSGGIVTIFKKSLAHLLEFPDTSSEYVQWVKIDSSIFGTDKNVLLGNIYIPPENTKYSCLDAFNEIESEMFQLSEHSDLIGLLGDINAKTGKLLDYVETDKSLLTIFDLQDDVDLINYMYDYENIVKAGASLSRNSNCTGRPNTYGHMLLDFCRKNNIYIVNGRVGKDKLIGECTCQDVSMIDYFLSSSKLFFHILDFEIKNFTPTLSDVHSQLHISLKIPKKENALTADENERSERNQARKWCSEKSQEYLQNLVSDDRLQNIIDTVDTIFIRHEHGELLSDRDINSVIDDIGILFDDNAKNVFGTKSSLSHDDSNVRRKQTPWFNSKCRTSRKAFHEARKTYNTYKTNVTRKNMNLASREYKKDLNQAYVKFQSRLSGEIREASSHNPKKFWDILKRCTNAKKSNIEVPLTELYEYFKNINSSDEEYEQNNDINNYNIQFGLEISNRMLNCSITDTEIENVVRNLPNNKAVGTDCIRNEYLKSTLHLLLPSYVKIFNIIFDTGIFPKSWTLGVIQPVYKNKGDSKDPSNYRPISLLSCFSKVFTSILNNRLNSFADEVNLISPSQAGFRKMHSTLDNIFILKSFIDLYFLHKKSYFVHSLTLVKHLIELIEVGCGQK